MEAPEARQSREQEEATYWDKNRVKTLSGAVFPHGEGFKIKVAYVPRKGAPTQLFEAYGYVSDAEARAELFACRLWVEQSARTRPKYLAPSARSGNEEDRPWEARLVGGVVVACAVSEPKLSTPLFPRLSVSKRASYKAFVLAANEKAQSDLREEVESFPSVRAACEKLYKGNDPKDDTEWLLVKAAIRGKNRAATKGKINHKRLKKQQKKFIDAASHLRQSFKQSQLGKEKRLVKLAKLESSLSAPCHLLATRELADEFIETIARKKSGGERGLSPEELSHAQLGKLFTQVHHVHCLMRKALEREDKIAQVRQDTLAFIENDDDASEEEKLEAIKACHYQCTIIRTENSVPNMAKLTCGFYGNQIAPTTLRKYYNEFEKKGAFEPDGRGKHIREGMFTDEAVLQAIKKFINTNEGVTIERVQQFLKAEYLLSEPYERQVYLEQYNITHLTQARTYHAMLAANCKYMPQNKHFYTDLHNTPAVIAAEKKFLRDQDELGKRRATFMLVKMDKVDEALFLSRQMDEDGRLSSYSLDHTKLLENEGAVYVQDGKEYLEMHVDRLKVRTRFSYRFYAFCTTLWKLISLRDSI